MATHIYINTISFSNERSFKVKRKRKCKRKKVYVVKPQFLRSFEQWEWHHPRNKLTETEKFHFHPKECWSRDRKTMTTKFEFTEPWRFVLQVRPNIITHTKMLDEVLEQKIQLIENRIENNHLRPRMTKLIWGRSWNHKWSFSELPKYKNPLKNKPLHRILEEVDNDNL